MQDMHGPNQCPEEFMGTHYPHTPGAGAPGQGAPAEGVDNYAVYNGMGYAADQVFGNLTRALKAKQLYNNTLIVPPDP
jgi:arylsulfatase A-like enzyme